MKKLRVVRERTRDESHEFDLRGFGNDPLLTQAFPFSVLSIATNRADSVEKAAKKQGFRLISTPSHDHVLFVPEQPREREHKKQALLLFTLLLARLSDLAPRARTRLFEVNWMRHQVQAAQKSNARVTLEEAAIAELAAQPSVEAFLTIDGSCATHLRQAGFPLQGASTALIRLEQTELVQLRQRLVAEHAATHGAKKKAA